MQNQGVLHEKTGPPDRRPKPDRRTARNKRPRRKPEFEASSKTLPNPRLAPGAIPSRTLNPAPQSPELPILPMRPRSPQTDAEWDSYYELRYQVLRAPWGQPRDAKRSDEDVPNVHAMIPDHRNRAVAVGRLLILSPTEGQIRSMATAEDMRGQGLGRQIMRYLEQAARDAGVVALTLNAREDAVPFYTKLGYEVVGEGPLLFGMIPHAAMRKQLTPPAGKDAAT
jgi:GNAT superfamily N-acetyltransferase